jgi:hypothetical protein
MPSQLKAEPTDAKLVQTALHAAGATHLRARTYGATVIVESGRTADPLKHFRLRRDSVHLWCLDMANHRGQWERTPFRDNSKALVTMVLKQFPWTLNAD